MVSRFTNFVTPTRPSSYGQGVHPKVVQERLGHSTISTTLDIYSHVTPPMQRKGTLKLQEALA